MKCKEHRMKQRFLLYLRSGTYYCEDTQTRKQFSLRTKDKTQALRLVQARNEAVLQPGMTLQIAQVYLQHSDPTLAKRTWQNVMDEMVLMKSGVTRDRWKTAIQNDALDSIRHRKLIETCAEHFLLVLLTGLNFLIHRAC
jgi:hypothetical protein